MTETELLLKNESSSVIVQDILNPHLTNPGKMIRPQLFSKLADLLGLAINKYQHICRAGELIHNATLIHDDVVDGAQVRRGRPTLNAKLTNAQAVLAGDYLLASVISELVELKKFEDLKTLSKTLEDIVEGELLQDFLKNKNHVTYDDLVVVSQKKTAALLAWGCGAVARAAELNDELTLKCIKLGEKVGIAFQMIDDNLDYSLDSGKPYAKDLQEGLINFTTLNLTQLYPELLYPVYQLRGQLFKDPPWSKQQMNEAINETKKNADLMFAEVYELISEIAESVNSSSKATSYLELKNFLELIQQRQQ